MLLHPQRFPNGMGLLGGTSRLLRRQILIDISLFEGPCRPQGTARIPLQHKGPLDFTIYQCTLGYIMCLYLLVILLFN